MSRILKLLCLAAFVLVLLQIAKVNSKEAGDVKKSKSPGAAATKLDKLLYELVHMKNKGKEGGEIMVSKVNNLKNEIKAELEKRSKKESKTPNSRLARSLSYYMRVLQATGTVSSRKIKNSIQELIDDIGRKYSEEIQKLSQNKSKSINKRRLSKANTLRKATQHELLKRAKSFKNNTRDFYNAGRKT